MSEKFVTVEVSAQCVTHYKTTVQIPLDEYRKVKNWDGEESMNAEMFCESWVDPHDVTGTSDWCVWSVEKAEA